MKTNSELERKIMLYAIGISFIAVLILALALVGVFAIVVSIGWI